jgi:hypothetical protein
MRVKKVNFEDATITLYCPGLKIQDIGTIGKSAVSKRGRASATTYLLVPKEFRNSLKNKDKYLAIKVTDGFIFIKAKQR